MQKSKVYHIDVSALSSDEKRSVHQNLVKVSHMVIECLGSDKSLVAYVAMVGSADAFSGAGSFASVVGLPPGCSVVDITGQDLTQFL